MSVYYLIGMIAMFGLGYRVGVAFERIRLRTQMMQGMRLFRVNAEDGTIEEMEDDSDGE